MTTYQYPQRFSGQGWNHHHRLRTGDANGYAADSWWTDWIRIDRPLISEFDVCKRLKILLFGRLFILRRRGRRNSCINDTPLWLAYGDATYGLASRSRDLGEASFARKGNNVTLRVVASDAGFVRARRRIAEIGDMQALYRNGNYINLCHLDWYCSWNKLTRNKNRNIKVNSLLASISLSACISSPYIAHTDISVGSAISITTTQRTCV